LALARVEIPPEVLGPMDDAWFRWVTDVGFTGPDKGRGGKYLLLPPGSTGDAPEGYFVARARTFGNLLFFRTFLKDGDPMPGVESVKKNLRVYPLSIISATQISRLSMGAKRKIW
jgi:hypothetical protein